MKHKLDNDTLLCLFLHGVTYDGDVPSKTERDELFDAGLISRSQGFQWLTDKGAVFAISCGYEAKQRQHQRRRRETGWDAHRYQWIRANMAYLLTGALTYEGESLADSSPARVDQIVDRAVSTSKAAGAA